MTNPGQKLILVSYSRPSTYLFTISEKNHFEKWLLIALKLKKGGRIPFGPKSVKYCVKIAGTSSHFRKSAYILSDAFLHLMGLKLLQITFERVVYTVRIFVFTTSN